MYAIVDIETTGGFAGRNKITEVAIYFHDGNGITGSYETLVNPGQVMPAYISGLTGITQPMVDKAPGFEEVAEDIHKLLQDKIFIAHNVHFDYSFLKRELESCGYGFSPKKVCTVRLSRHLLPGMRSYSLGKLCEQLKIPIANRHRAGGDAKATAILFDQLLKKDSEYVAYAIKRTSGETKLPPNLPKEEYEGLPEEPGVYYFINAHSEVIYVGKAKNIKKRTTSHFSGTSKNKRNQYIRNEIHHISYELTGNELVALLLESQEIKRLWPKYNRAQKFRTDQWGIYRYEDQHGYTRFNINKLTRGQQPVALFHNHADAWHFLIDKVKEYELCPKLCGIQKSNGACYDHAYQKCSGACIQKEDAAVYNERLRVAMASFDNKEKSFAILGSGRHEDELSIIIVENGCYHGFGFCEKNVQVNTLEAAKNFAHKYRSTIEIDNYIASYLNSPRAEVVELD